MLRSLFFMLIVTAVASPVMAQSAAPPLTVDDAVAIAVANNRRLANAALEVDKANFDVQSARSRRLPQFNVELLASQLLRPVDVRFPQGAFGDFPGIGPVPAIDTSVTTDPKPAFVLSTQISQPLTQLRRIGLDIKLAQTSQELEREVARASRLTVEHDVKRLYFSILQSESAIVAADQSLTLLRELQRVVGDRVVQRTALDGDALAVDVRLARAEAARDALVNTVASQKEQFNQLLGRDIRTPFVTAGIPSGDPVTGDAASVHTRALAARPDVRQARARLEQAELARQRARSDYLPDVSLALSYMSPMNIDGAPRHIASAGVQLKWEPFDWGRRSHAIASRGLAVQQATNALRDQEAQAMVEVNARVRRLSEANRDVQVAGLAQRAARETSRVRAAQYRVQSALLSDVLQAAAAQADADHQYVQALAALWVARAEFERAVGEE